MEVKVCGAEAVDTIVRRNFLLKWSVNSLKFNYTEILSEFKVFSYDPDCPVKNFELYSDSALVNVLINPTLYMQPNAVNPTLKDLVID
jgi:hypothetical protein